jgi:ribosome maturation factor RimP
MSKIQAELLKATDLSTKRGEDRQDFLARVMKEVAGLDDKGWEELSKAAQDWFNDAADAKNAKAKVLPDFPDADADEPAEEKKTSRRVAAKEEVAAPVKPKVGVVAKITTKRGKTSTGTIVELDDEVVVIKHGDGTEEEFDRSRVESIEVAGGEAAPEKDEEAADPIVVGAEVTVLTKRGKSVTGKIVELDDDLIVLDADGKDEEFARDRVESITPVKAKGVSSKGKPEAAEETKSGRRAAKDEAGGRRGGEADEAKADDKPKRSSNPAGVSVGTRIKELIAEDFEATEEEIGKALKKEGIEYRDNTLKLQFTDCHKFIDILKKQKKIKG